MTNEVILKKAIDKAVENGYNYEYMAFNYMYEYMSKTPYVIGGFIFSHSFAKAFWGEEDIIINCPNECFDGNPICIKIQRWKYHLQQMVLCEEPLKYLEKFL